MVRRAKIGVYRAGALDDPDALIAFREAHTTYGYLGQDDPDLTIGLGREQTRDIQVRFSNGRERVVRGVESEGVVTIDAGKP